MLSAKITRSEQPGRGGGGRGRAGGGTERRGERDPASAGPLRRNRVRGCPQRRRVLASFTSIFLPYISTWMDFRVVLIYFNWQY